MRDFSKNNKYKILAITFVILLGALIRAGHLLAPHIDSDQAVFGLQGMHVLKGEFPVFSWGYAYIGTLQSYIDAVFFYFFGPSREMLNFVPILFYAGYAVSLFYLSRVLFKNFLWQILTVTLGAIAPHFFVVHGAWGRHGYPETFCFGSIMLALIALNVSKNKNFFSYFILLFIAGLAWWTNFLIIYYYLPLGAYLFYQLIFAEKKLKQKVSLLIASASGFFIGGLPFWIYNLKNNFISFDMFKSAPQGSPLLESIGMLFSKHFPVLIGAIEYDIRNKVPYFHMFLTVLAGYFFIFFLIYRGVLFFRNLFKRKIEPWDFLWLFYVAIIGIYFKSKYSSPDDSSSIRYLIPIYSLYPFVMVYFLSIIEESLNRKKIALALSGFIIFMNGASIWFSNPFFHKNLRDKYNAKMQYEKEVFDGVANTDVREFLMFDYWSASLYTFDAKEKLIFADVNCRYPKYVSDMMPNPTFNYLLPDKSKPFMNGANLLGYDFRNFHVSKFEMFTDFKKNMQLYPETISRFAMKFNSNLNRENVKNLNNFNFNSNFIVEPQKQKPHYLDVNFNESKNICGFSIYLENRFMVPSHIKVINPVTNEVILDAKDFLQGFEVAGKHPLIIYAPNFFEIYFKPANVKSLRLSFEELYRTNLFAIKEILFFEDMGKNYIETKITPEEFIKNKKDSVHTVYSSIGTYNTAEKYFNKSHIKLSYEQDHEIDFEKSNLFIFETPYLNHNIEILDFLDISYEHYLGEKISCIISRPNKWKKAMWSGKAIFAFDDKKSSEKSFKIAKKYLNKNDAEAKEFLEKALFEFDHHYYANLLLIDLYKKTNNTLKLEKAMYNLNSIFPVRDSIEVKFKSKKIALKGITLPSGQLKQGDSFNMDFYFLFEEKVRNDFAVFVHFKSPDGKTLFQNDHFLGNDTNIKHFIEGELLEDQSIITIPSKLEYKGKVEIWLGIWDPYKKKRFKPETPLPNKDRSVKLGEFNIE